MSTEISKEAFFHLVGNDEKSWCDYKANNLYERSYYRNFGVILFTSTHFVNNTTKYFIMDINTDDSPMELLALNINH